VCGCLLKRVRAWARASHSTGGMGHTVRDNGASPTSGIWHPAVRQEEVLQRGKASIMPRPHLLCACSQVHEVYEEIVLWEPTEALFNRLQGMQPRQEPASQVGNPSWV
jgi:hypothetical protein